MPKFIVNEAFQYRGSVRREGSVIIVGDDELKQESDKGYKKRTIGGKEEQRHLSGLISHCTPADDDTARLVSKALGRKVDPIEEEDPDKEAEDEAARVDALRKDMGKLGIGFDNRWGLTRLQNEMIKAKKEKGL